MKQLIGLVAAILLCAYLLVAGIAQEIPTASVEGTLTMKENGRPLDAHMAEVGALFGRAQSAAAAAAAAASKGVAGGKASSSRRLASRDTSTSRDPVVDDVD